LLQAQPFQQLVDECRLAGPHFAGEQHKSLAALDAVSQTRQRLLGMPREEQITRVGVDVKRIRPQAVELFVHNLWLKGLRL